MNKLLGKILGSRWTKAAVFALCLVPILLLARPLWMLATTGYSPDLTANPIEYITHYTGTWTIRFLLITLSVTPFRKIFNQPRIARYRRMLGLFAFFYVCLHFLTWFVLDKFFSFPEMWADILKRRYITVGMLGFAMLVPLAVTSTAGWVRRLGFVAMAALAPADLLRRASGRHSLLLAGEIRCAAAVDVWRDSRGPDALPPGHAQADTASRGAPSGYHSEYGVPS